MSVLRSLLRWIDPVRSRRESHEIHLSFEALPPASDPDPVEAALADAARPGGRPDARLVCRVCGYAGEDRFCPRCLAGTMEPRR